MKYLSIVVFTCYLLASCKNQNNNPLAPPAIETVLAYQIDALLGEGPIWNHKTQTLWWVDIEGKAFNIYNPNSGINTSYPTPSRIGTVVPTEDGNALVALEDGLYMLNPSDGQITSLLPIEAGIDINRFNDGKCDPAGRMWVGSMNMAQDTASGHLYSIDKNQKVVKHLNDITISNGIVWTKNSKTMYYIDTPTGQIRAFDYDANTGTIDKEKVAVVVPQSLGYPDGMAIDEEDKLWVGMWNGNCVARFDPQLGILMSTIAVPAHNITACAFGGPNLDTLYITTASLDMTEEEKLKYPMAGSIFKVTPGVKGVQSTFYKSE